MTTPNYVMSMGRGQAHELVKTATGRGVIAISVSSKGEIGGVQISVGAGPVCRYPGVHARIKTSSPKTGIAGPLLDPFFQLSPGRGMVPLPSVHSCSVTQIPGRLAYPPRASHVP